MEEQKINLVRNSIDSLGNYSLSTFNKMFNEHTEEQIKELARDELKRVNKLIKIELPNWDYWKKKKITLKNIINE